MTMTMKTTKNEMIKFLQSKNIDCNEKMTKNVLFDLIENFTKNVKNEIVSNVETIQTNETIENVNTIATIETIKNDENTNNVNSMSNEFEQFLITLNVNYKIENEMFIIFANNKHIFVKIDNDDNYSYVFTILNKKMSNDMNTNKLFARNILTLKSLKATKSYTLSNCK